ncbi:MAG: hypothetical protein HPY45_16205 [Anaerolineae bacterium]|nr:hypothetical protein [Anaerolineae bacterium]
MAIKKALFTVLGYLSLIAILTGCVSQRDIEVACLQTLSVLTPVCMCESTTQSPVSNATPSPSLHETSTTVPDAIQSLSSTPQIQTPPSPISNPPIFNADFENGDLSAFTEPGGEYFGKGVFYDHAIVSEPAVGNYSAALSIGSGDSTAAYLFVYRTPSTPLAIYSADYWIPSEIIPDDWWNVWQWKSKNETYDKPTVTLNLLQLDGVLQVVLFHTPGAKSTNETQVFYQVSPLPFPTNQWVNLSGTYLAKEDDTGSVIISQNGVKIFEVVNILTKPGNEKVLWSINSYADAIFPNPATIYVDNIQIREIQ